MRKVRVLCTLTLARALLVTLSLLLLTTSGAFATATQYVATSNTCDAAAQLFNPVIVQPIGVAATEDEVLFTKPWCEASATQGTRGIYTLNPTTGATSLFATLPHIAWSATGDPNTDCAENYIAISSGLGGFPAGTVYASSTQTPQGFEIYQSDGGGGPATLFTRITVLSPFGPINHVGITFDTVGTFGFRMIATAIKGVVAIDSTGLNQQVLAVAPAGVELEASNVAPLNFGGAFAGWLLISESAGNANGAIVAVNPAGPFPAPMLPFATTAPRPEGLNFVPSACPTTQLPPTIGGFEFFVSGYGIASQITLSEPDEEVTCSAMLEYSSAVISPLAGKILVPHESAAPATAGIVEAFTNTGTASVVDNTTRYDLEGSAIVACAPGAGCPATFGFWKHHNFPCALFTGGTCPAGEQPTGTVNIGCTSYTAAQLLDILNTAPKGGNAVLILAHQLIAALANISAGSQVTVEAAQAIAAAESLLCANNLNLATSFEQASTALGQQLTALADILDNFNSAVGLNCNEGEGLVTSPD
jgi:hypothetical protein